MEIPRVNAFAERLQGKPGRCPGHSRELADGSEAAYDDSIQEDG